MLLSHSGRGYVFWAGLERTLLSALLPAVPLPALLGAVPLLLLALLRLMVLVVGLVVELELLLGLGLGLLAVLFLLGCHVVGDSSSTGPLLFIR